MQVAGFVVCLLLVAATLVAMNRCDKRSEKILHVEYPAVTLGLDTVT